MKTRRLMCACTIAFIFLVGESQASLKSDLNANNWGPHSLLYLKGRYGRRLAPDYDGNGVYNLGLKDWYTALKGFQKLKAVVVRKSRRMLKTERTVIGSLG